jgi:hypothetical protein
MTSRERVERLHQLLSKNSHAIKSEFLYYGIRIPNSVITRTWSCCLVQSTISIRYDYGIIGRQEISLPKATRRGYRWVRFSVKLILYMRRKSGIRSYNMPRSTLTRNIRRQYKMHRYLPPFMLGTSERDFGYTLSDLCSRPQSLCKPYNYSFESPQANPSPIGQP